MWSSSHDTNVEDLKIDQLRRAIRSNRISFPAQVPWFPKHDRPDLQPKIALLYFLFGWSCGRIGERYGLRRQRVQQILNTWTTRAVQTGYLQTIPPANPLTQWPHPEPAHCTLRMVPNRIFVPVGA